MNTRPGRNDPCHCGSGKKYKKCCLERDNQAILDDRAAEEAALKLHAESPREEYEVLNHSGDAQGDKRSLSYERREELRRERLTPEQRALEDACEAAPDDFAALAFLAEWADAHPGQARTRHFWFEQLLRDYLPQALVDHPEATRTWIRQFRKVHPRLLFRSFPPLAQDLLSEALQQRDDREARAWVRRIARDPWYDQALTSVVVEILFAHNRPDLIAGLFPKILQPAVSSKYADPPSELLEFYIMWSLGNFLDLPPAQRNIPDFLDRLGEEVFNHFDLELFCPPTRSEIKHFLDLLAGPPVLFDPSLHRSFPEAQSIIPSMCRSFLLFLHENHGLSWSSADFYSRQAGLLIAKRLQRQGKEHKRIRQDLYAISLNDLTNLVYMTFPTFLTNDDHKRYAALNALYWLAGFLQIHGLINSRQADTLRDSCQTLHRQRFPDDVDIQPWLGFFATFPLVLTPNTTDFVRVPHPAE